MDGIITDIECSTMIPFGHWPGSTKKDENETEAEKEPEEKPASSKHKNYCMKDGVMHFCAVDANKKCDTDCRFYVKHSYMNRCRHLCPGIKNDKGLSHCDSLEGQKNLYLSKGE